MTETQSRRSGALEDFAVFALVLTFLLRYVPFLDLGHVRIYGPIFSEFLRPALVSRSHRISKILRGLPVFENQHFSILHPFV